MSGADAIVPKGEALRRAVRWISEQGCWSSRVIEEASLRFNLSPKDEEFLLEHFVRNPPRPKA